MKIEEYKEEGVKEKLDKNWRPFSKGFERLYIVAGIILTIIIASTQRRDDDVLGAIILTPLALIVLYFAIVWIYRGFRDK